MLTCRRASERLSRALDGTLPANERLGLWAHLLLCGPCCRYRKQLRMLDEAFREEANRLLASSENEHLPNAAKERIAVALERHIAGGG